MSEETIHDLRERDGEAGVVLIVRQHNKYGTAHAGERVRVDESELQNRSTMEACMTLETYEKHQRERAAKKPEPAKSTQLKATVDAELKRIQEQALEKQRKREAAAATAPPPVTPSTPPTTAKAKKKQPE